MNYESQSPFETIESAHDLLRLLCEAVADSRRDLQAEIEAETAPARRLDALRVALYCLEKLELHVNTSRRILNDLRSLRRLLLAERSSAAVPVAAKPVSMMEPGVKVAPFTTKSQCQVSRSGAGPGSAAA